MLDLLEITSTFIYHSISNTELKQTVHTGLLTVAIYYLLPFQLSRG